MPIGDAEAFVGFYLSIRIHYVSDRVASHSHPFTSIDKALNAIILSS